MSEARSSSGDRETTRRVFEAVDQICSRNRIGALDEFLESTRSFAEEKLLNIAVLGRFKAGKSTFLNHLLGTFLLPAGVVPVTAAVTEIQYGPRERAEVHFLDGHIEAVSADRIAEFIAEAQNPGNAKRVALVRLELPSMERYRRICFVDTPGLESVFEHNTDASMTWLPNVGLALVAVCVDTPLSQRDVELIRNLSRYTPNISLLLTKVDLLDKRGLDEVKDFVYRQLARHWNGAVPIFSYSVKPGFEHLQSKLEVSLLLHASAEEGQHRSAILRHKIDSLLAECSAYLNVALKSAEIADAERAQLRQKILGNRESIDDARLALRLIVRHTAGTIRATLESLLRNDELPVRERLLASLDREFPSWTRSLGAATQHFEDWLRARLAAEMSDLSTQRRREFVEPVHRCGRQLSQSLQDFRNRLSERVLETLGVPLRTTELEFAAHDPRAPDVRVGKIFDHNWEVLSFLAPMKLIKRLVRKHFERKVNDAVFANLSRLAAQWEEADNTTLVALEEEAVRRLDTLVATVEGILTSAAQEAAGIREDLRRLETLQTPEP